MRYKVKTQDCHLIVRAKASWGEDINVKALEAFAGMHIQGFMTPKVIKNNVVEFFGPIGISLHDRLRNLMSKHEFLFVIEQIIVAVQELQSNGLPISGMVFDLNNVFINDVTKEIRFLYIPSLKEMSKQSMVSFVESIIYSVRPENKVDAEFISRFIYFLKGQKVFSPEVIEQYIAREDPSVIDTIKKQNVGQDTVIPHTPNNHYEHSAGTDPNNMLWQGSEETEVLSENFVANPREMERHDNLKGLLSEGSDHTEDTVPLNVRTERDLLNLFDDEAGGTVVLSEMWTVHYPSLFRVQNKEQINIDKPVFRIGKERSSVDYCVTNNNTVSRKHANIVTRGNKYFVVDTNSKNHTYINGQRIAPECETEIHDGDRLRLANEEFSFSV